MRSGDRIARLEAAPVEPPRDEASPGRADQPRSGTSGELPGTSGGPIAGPKAWLTRPWLPYATVALFTVAICAVNALTAAHDRSRQGAGYDIAPPALWEGTSALVIIVVLPLVALAAKRLRRCGGWGSAAVLFSGAAVAFSVIHVVGMVALRKLAYAAVGRSYGFDWISDLGYELRKDVVTFALVTMVFWLFEVATERRPPATASASVAPPGRSEAELWLRDGTTRVRIDAREIVWVASAGNYVEFQLSGRSYLVRGTLTGEEQRLVPFGVVRVHRTRLVNLNRVVAVEPRPSGEAELRLDTGETVVASRRYRQALEAIPGSR